MTRLTPVILILVFMVIPREIWGADFQRGQAAYNQGDYVTAFSEWEPLAANGNVRAQVNLGVMYDQGLGVIQSRLIAIKWYKLAAAQGNLGAQYNLAIIYKKGEGVPQSLVNAYMWFDISASLGFKFSVAQLEDVAVIMDESAIVEAKRLALECRVKNYQDC